MDNIYIIMTDTFVTQFPTIRKEHKRKGHYKFVYSGEKKESKTCILESKFGVNKERVSGEMITQFSLRESNIVHLFTIKNKK